MSLGAFGHRVNVCGRLTVIVVWAPRERLWTTVIIVWAPRERLWTILILVTRLGTARTCMDHCNCRLGTARTFMDHCNCRLGTAPHRTAEGLTHHSWGSHIKRTRSGPFIRTFRWQQRQKRPALGVATPTPLQRQRRCAHLWPQKFSFDIA